MGTVIDRTGWTFGIYRFVRHVARNVWIVQCVRCNAENPRRVSQILADAKKSKRCASCRSACLDIVGKVVGPYRVASVAGVRDGHAYVYVECTRCGVAKAVPASYIRSKAAQRKRCADCLANVQSSKHGAGGWSRGLREEVSNGYRAKCKPETLAFMLGVPLETVVAIINELKASGAVK